MCKGSLDDIEKLCRDYIGSRLSPGRAAHCERTFQKALELNGLYGVGLARSALAQVTLLHDCAREATAAEIEKVLTAEKIATVPGGSSNVGLLHGFAGALLVERDLGIKDKEVLEAISYHVTGRDEPSDLLTLQIISDLLEDGRPFRDLVPKPKNHSSLYGLGAAALGCKLAHCLDKNEFLIGDAVAAYNWYVRQTP